MIQFVKNNKLKLIIIHLVFGWLSTFEFFPKIYGVVSLSILFIFLIRGNNQNEEAMIFASYVTGIEVFLRMTNGLVLYETGKYAVMLFLITGIFIGDFKQKFSLQYIIYLFLLLIGIVFTQVPEGESLRKNIIFNLSGPVVLGVAAFYFFKRPILKEQIMNALFFMLLPLFSMVCYLYFETPDLKDLVFNTAANFKTSGGFGPNQVATAIGLGVLIIGVFILAKVKFTGYPILDYFFLIYFIYRGLLTFSRGGIFAAAISFTFFSILYLIHKKVSTTALIKYLITITAIVSAVWLYTSEITGGMLDNRYYGKNAIGKKKKDITTGRLDILNAQFDVFQENPMGIGVGNGKYRRLKSMEKITAASHNEIGRLIEEHGIIGMFLLLILIFIPLFNFFGSDFFNASFTVCFFLMWFLTVNHSAMRVAMPGFIYALSLIKIIKQGEEY